MSGDNWRHRSANMRSGDEFHVWFETSLAGDVNEC